MTPEEAWPAVDAHHGASGGYGGSVDGYANGWGGWDQRSQSGPRGAESRGRHDANSYRTGGYTGTAGTGTGGYGGSVDGYANGWDGWAARTGTGSTTGTDDWSGWASRTGTGSTMGTDDWSGWAMGGSGHAERSDAFDGVPANYGTAPNGYSADPTGYADAATGYADDLDAFDGSRNGYASTPNGYGGIPNGYGGTANGYGGTANGYGGTANGYGAAANGYAGEFDGFDGAGSGYGASDGFAEAQDGFDGSAGYLDHGQYAALSSSDPMLSAPDAGVHPDGWRAEQNRRLEMSQRGVAVGAVTVFLAVAVAVGVSTLAAAFVRPQASPMTTAGNVLIDRLPFSLKNFAVQHFGGHSHAVLLLGMYVVLGLVALEVGMLTRRAAAGGVIGIAALSLLGAFIVITRPGGRVTDLMPAVIGGLVGVTALLWLRRASAPTPEYPGRRSRRRA